MKNLFMELKVVRKLHIGCGMNAPDDFENFDASPTLRFEKIPIIGKFYTKNETRFPENIRYGNIAYGLTNADNQYDACYCSHVLEHLSMEEFNSAIRNIYKYLKTGGIFRLIMPDLNKYVTEYVREYNKGSVDASIKFMKLTLLGESEFRKRDFFNIFINGISNSRHNWLWDDISTIEALKKAGFKNILSRRFKESGVDYFSNIEKEESFKNAFCIECIK